MNHDYSADLQRVWNRLRIMALTLQNVQLEDGDVQEIGAMIDDMLVDDLQPVIDALAQGGKEAV